MIRDSGNGNPPPSCIHCTKPVTRIEISKALMLTTQQLFGKHPIWKIAQNTPGSAIREGSHRAPYSRLQSPPEHLLKTGDKPVLREKSIISPRDGSDCKRTPPGI